MNRNLHKLFILVLLFFAPGMAWSGSSTPTEGELTLIGQKALLGDQNAALEMWGFYGWGNGDTYPGAFAKEKYWLQISAEDGGGLNYLEFSQILQNYLVLPDGSGAGINDNIRSFYWAKLAALYPKTILHINPEQTQLSANFELFGTYSERARYWKSVASYFSSNPLAANQAIRMENRPPSFIPVNALDARVQDKNGMDTNQCYNIKITQDNLVLLKMDALLGDPAAGCSVAAYFETERGTNELYWQTIAAEDGDSAAQIWLAIQLSKSSDPNDRIRAIFWATKVSKQAKNSILIERANEILQASGNKYSATLEPP